MYLLCRGDIDTFENLSKIMEKPKPKKKKKKKEKEREKEIE